MARSVKTNAHRKQLSTLLLLTFLVIKIQAQAPSPVQQLFPQGTITYPNIPYSGDTVRKHLLDIYLPHNARANTPLVVWVHGGAWMLNDKYADMGYMKATIKGFLDSGYALASIDYRWSTTAPFPAQIQDCNKALEYLYEHATQYKLDRSRIALIGFSAGGHLASLLALSHNNNVKRFYPAGIAPKFSIKCVLDFYGPADLLAASMSTDTAMNNAQSPIAVLLGAVPVERPDIAKQASPVTYVDKSDPPFFIVQGEKDESVPNTQSKLLHSWLTLAGVPNELIIVPNAPHYGAMFDAEWIRKRLFRFLALHMK